MDPGSHTQYTAVYGLFSSSFYVNTHTHVSTQSHAHTHSFEYRLNSCTSRPSAKCLWYAKVKRSTLKLGLLYFEGFTSIHFKNRELSRVYKQLIVLLSLYCLCSCRRALCFFWAVWKLQKDSFSDLAQKPASHKGLVLVHAKPVLLTFYFIFYFVLSLVLLIAYRCGVIHWGMRILPVSTSL